jgi:predicted transcriptional regulator
MGQIAIYLDDTLQKQLDTITSEEGISRSSWISQVIRQKLEEKLPEAWFQVLGSWEDKRSPSAIIKEIRAHTHEKRREEFR